MVNEIIQRNAERVKKIVDIYRANGFDVREWTPLGEEHRFPCDDSHCWFNRVRIIIEGEENEGLRAIEIGKQHGIPIGYISHRRNVSVVTYELLSSSWEIGF